MRYRIPQLLGLVTPNRQSTDALAAQRLLDDCLKEFNAFSMLSSSASSLDDVRNYLAARQQFYDELAKRANVNKVVNDSLGHGLPSHQVIQICFFGSFLFALAGVYFLWTANYLEVFTMACCSALLSLLGRGGAFIRTEALSQLK